MRTTAVFLAMLSIWMAIPALAADLEWYEGCGSSPTVSAMRPGHVYCANPATNADITRTLGMLDCNNFDVTIFSDKTGAGAACTVAWDLQACPAKEGDLSAAAEDVACFQPSGYATFTPPDADTNLGGAGYIRFVGDGAGANATSCQIQVRCAEPGSR
jgi:hypothetical protein